MTHGMPWIPGMASSVPEIRADVVSDADGGGIYADYLNGNSRQSQQSVYYREPGSHSWGIWPEAPAWVQSEFTGEQEWRADVTTRLVHYIFNKLEPTDRCLRPPGDIYPPEGRPCKPGGEPWDEPWDGE